MAEEAGRGRRNSDHIRVSDTSAISMPIRNLIAMVVGAAIGTWAYFGIIERLNTIENKIILMEADLGMNTEFRIKWPRGEMGSLPADSEQFMLIEHLSEQLAKLQEQADQGKLPHDQQQKLTLDFYEKRLTNIETQIEKIRNAQRGN